MHYATKEHRGFILECYHVNKLSLKANMIKLQNQLDEASARTYSMARLCATSAKQNDLLSFLDYLGSNNGQPHSLALIYNIGLMCFYYKPDKGYEYLPSLEPLNVDKWWSQARNTGKTVTIRHMISEYVSKGLNVLHLHYCGDLKVGMNKVRLINNDHYMSVVNNLESVWYDTFIEWLQAYMVYEQDLTTKNTIQRYIDHVKD